MAVLRAPHGTPMYFHLVRDGFEPASGVHANMSVAEVDGRSLYTVTTGSQATYVFTDTGQLLRQYDAKGNVLDFTYNVYNRSRPPDRFSRRFMS